MVHVVMQDGACGAAFLRKPCFYVCVSALTILVLILGKQFVY